MIIYKNDCCGCASPGYPCRGESCDLRNNPHYFCDRCGEEVDPEELYEDNGGEQLCVDCILKEYKKVGE